MDITEIRRENLRRWVERNGTPQKEKSMFSQLKSTGSFGEKVARRLEVQYRMGDGYLDTPNAEVQQAGVVADPLKLTAETADEMRLLAVYRMCDDRGRRQINSLVEILASQIKPSVRNDG